MPSFMLLGAFYLTQISYSATSLRNLNTLGTLLQACLHLLQFLFLLR